MESTYGDRVHPDRASELRKLDAKVREAVKSKTDILVVTLALERPVYVLYEILKCLENSNINPEDVDISYF
jgi:predicted metal-dependent RNase